MVGPCVDPLASLADFRFVSSADLLLSAIGVSGAAVIAWATWRSPAWAVALVVASVPLQAFARIGLEGSGVTWTQAWAWTFLGAGAMLFASGSIAIRFDLATLLLASVVVCYIVSRHAVVNDVVWQNEVYRWSLALAFFVLARATLRGHRLPSPLLNVTALGAIWTGIVAVIQVATASGPESFQRGGRPRAYATFGEPNTYGAFAAGSLVVLTAFLLFHRPARSRWSTVFQAVGCGSAVVGVVLSQSRGALAATAVVVAAMAALKLNALAVVPRTARAIAAVAICLVPFLAAPDVARRIATSDTPVEVTGSSWAEQERTAHWSAATRMIVDSNGLGVGAGQFDQRYREFTPAWRFRIPQGHAHDAYLQVAAETGLLGGAAYAALFLSVAVSLRRRQRICALSGVAAVALAATGVFALHNLVDYLHVLNLPIILLAWWATALSEGDGMPAS